MKRFFLLLAVLTTTSPIEVHAAVPDTPAARQARETAPQLFAYTESVLFGDLWQRPELSKRDRSMVTMSSLLSNGQAAQLTSHINLALENGVKPAEIIGLITHLAFYAGWPNAMSAVGVARNVFTQRGIAEKLWHQDGEALLPTDTRTDVLRATLANATSTAPALAKFSSEVLVDDLWRRPDLTPRDRSMITVAALIATGDKDQLAFHLKRAMELGLTRSQAAEVVTHLAFYSGWPRAMSALPIMQSVFSQRP